MLLRYFWLVFAWWQEIGGRDQCIRALTCCTRCSHIWRSQPMKNDDDEEVKPGNPICALCMTPAMLDAEAANATRHFRIAALAWMEWLFHLAASIGIEISLYILYTHVAQITSFISAGECYSRWYCHSHIVYTYIELLSVISNRIFLCAFSCIKIVLS